MITFKLFGKCYRCKRNRLFVRTARIYIKELKQEATLKDGLMCGSCIRIIKKAL